MNLNHLKKYLLAGLFLFSFNSFSAGSSISEMMAGLDGLDKNQVEQMIDVLQKSGNISGEDAKKAKLELAKMSPNDFKVLKKKAHSIVKDNKKKENDYNSGVKKSVTTTDKGAFGMEVE